MGKDVLIKAPTAHMVIKALKPVTPCSITVNINNKTIIDEDGNEIPFSEENLKAVLERILGN